MIRILKMKYCILLLWVFYFHGYAQIQVHEEPFHHPVFLKSSVRILDVVTHPNDTSLIHQHSNNYCYVTLNGGKIWVENEGEEGRTLELPTGFVGGYFENPRQPLVHRFANRSDDLIRLIAVENLTAGSNNDSVFQLMANEEVIVDNSYFFITQIPLSPSQQIDFYSSLGSVIINPDQNPLLMRVNDKPEPLNDWAWLDAKSHTSIHNQGSKKANIMVIRLKVP